MEIGFVFTNYNNSAYSILSIESLATTPAWRDCRVVIVDNASQEKDLNLLAQLSESHPEIDVIYNDSNLGYFSGLNVGIEFIRNKHPNIHIVVIGNNDLVFPANFFELVHANSGLFEKHPVVSPDIVTLDDIHQNPHAVAEFTALRLFLWKLYYADYHIALVLRALAKLTRLLTERKDYTNFSNAGPIAQGFGACYLLGPLFWQNFKTLWAPTFLMHEEFFFSEQLKSKGYMVYYTPGITVRHHCHASVGNLPSRRLWELSRDAYLIMLKNPAPPE